MKLTALPKHVGQSHKSMGLVCTQLSLAAVGGGSFMSAAFCTLTRTQQLLLAVLPVKCESKVYRGQVGG